VGPRFGRSLSVLAVIALAGCGNAYESVSVGDWQEAGTAQPPTRDVVELRGNLIVKELAAGRGNKVKAGDLVHIRISAKEGRFVPNDDSAQRQVIWLWVGRDPELGASSYYLNWGSPGSARLRKELVGRAVGDRLEARLEPTAEGLIALPVKGLEVRGSLLGANIEPWPRFEFDKKTSVEIEILDACAARMFKRTAAIRQFGFIVGMFGSASTTARQGELHWSALEAQCPHQLVRFEIGPLYSPDARTVGRLALEREYLHLGEKGGYRTLLGLRLEIWVLVAALLVIATALIVWRRTLRNKAASPKADS
jgi:hypothetical protein